MPNSKVKPATQSARRTSKRPKAATARQSSTLRVGSTELAEVRHESSSRNSKAKSPPGLDAKAKPSARETKDWREETLSRMRALILEADPEMIEERKWKKPSNPAGVPVWSHPVEGRGGIICTGETYKNVVKLTFARGASIPDPSHLFNSSLEGNTRRAIDIREGEIINARAFKALVKAAVTQNAVASKR